VIIIILLVTAFVAPGFAKTKVLNASSVQDGVQKILTDTYKVTDVSKVSCPAGHDRRQGHRRQGDDHRRQRHLPGR